MHEQTMAILNTSQQKLHKNGHLGAHTRALIKHASKNETDNIRLKTGAGMATVRCFRPRSFQTARSDPLCYSKSPQHFQTTGSADERPQFGCPRCTDRRGDCYLQLLALRNRTITQKALIGNLRASTNVTISGMAVTCRLRELCLH